MTPRFSLSIMHADFVPGRPKSLQRLLDALSPLPIEVGIVRGKRSTRERDELQWNWGANSDGVSHCVQMEDDVIPCPNFWRHVTDAITARPDDIVSFYAITPAAKAACEAGASWATTRDGMLGTAYVLPKHVLLDFLAWRQRALTPKALERYPADGQINLYALREGLPIFHTLPSLVAHDDTLESTNTFTRIYASNPVPYVEREHHWEREPVECGWAFRQYHWHLATETIPGTVSRELLAKLERDRYRWTPLPEE